MIEGWRKVPYSIQSCILELEVHFHVLRSTFNTWSAVELEYGNVYDLHLHGILRFSCTVLDLGLVPGDTEPVRDYIRPKKL
jgi:hypothetical protein